MVLPDFMYYIFVSNDLSYVMGQCNGQQRESGFPAWGTVRRFDMDSMVMTIYDSLKMPTLEHPLKDIMGKFTKKMLQLFMDLGEGARASAFISTFSWRYALDVP
ncbi:hypothetical protein L6452_04014 [Arctium lappa]|uniref:Uncharacterized protein n=1 Tax=Arctium lappa TaxID=4217 RepID=A0ACB9FPS4_ARCLA|nr:hypothetical protein L6452_04014 [Arctium lappa]